MRFTWVPFSELSTTALYDVLALRSQVFVIEQNCVYLDPDGKDKHAIHLLGYEDEKLLAYMRLFPPGSINNDEIIFGRIATSQFVRGKGYGKQLMQQLLDYCEKHYPAVSIICSAQLYLKAFYESYRFVAYSNVYSEDDRPHIAMRRLFR